MSAEDKESYHHATCFDAANREMPVEKPFRETEERYRALLEELHDGVFIAQDHRFVFFNAALPRMLGHDTTEFENMPFTSVIAPEDLAIWTERFNARVAAGPEPARHYMVRLLRSSGDRLEVELSARRILHRGRSAVLGVLRDVSERRKAENALRLRELRYRTLLSAIGAITWSCPSSGLHVEPQPEWMAFTGQTGEEMLGDGWSKAVHPDDVAATAANWQDAVTRCEPYAGEIRVRRHDGQWRWMSVRAAPIHDANGDIVEWFGMHIDITERKKADTALLESEQRLRRVSDNADVGLTRLSRDWRYLSVNPAYAIIVGKPLDEIIGRTSAEVMGDEAAEVIRPYVERVLRGERVTYEAEVPLGGAGKRYLHVSYTPDTDASERIVGWVACVTDITERKRDEIALRESEQRSRLALEAARAGTWEWNAIKNDSMWDDRFASLYGFPSGSRSGFNTWIEQVHPEDRAQLLSRIEKVIAEPDEDEWNEEFRAILPDGRVRWHHGIGRGERDAAGALSGMFGIDLDVTERKEAEAALRASEERLRRVSENAAVGLTRLTRDGIFLSANRAYVEISGRPLDQIIGRSVEEVISAEAAEQIRPYVERVLTGETVTFEAELNYKGVGNRHVQLSYTPETDGEGEIVGWVTSITDITERKKADAALRESEERFRKVFTHAAMGVAIGIPDERIMHCNPAYSTLLGYSESELSQMDFSGFIHPDDRAENRAKLHQLMAGELDEFEIENRYIRKDGEAVWVRKYVSLLPDQIGKPSRLLILATDTTERRRADAARAEERLRAVVEGATEAILTLDASGVIKSINAAGEKVFGFKRSELVGRELSILDGGGHEDERPGLLGEFKRSATTGCSGELKELRGRRKNGSLLPLEVAIFEAKEEVPRRFVAFMRDLSAQRAAEARAEQLGAERQAALGGLALALAHEINQPFLAAVSYLASARHHIDIQTTGSSEFLERTLSLASGQMIRAGEIIRDLRLFAKSGEPDKTFQQMHALIRDVVTAKAGLLQEVQVSTILRLRAERDSILVDRVQIDQVLTNLIRNACQAMSTSQKKELCIETVLQEGGVIRIDVTDTGGGISEKVRNRIFEPFATTSAAGFGVGLSIASSIIAAHYGEIWVESTGPGGTRLSFVLPLVMGDEPSETVS